MITRPYQAWGLGHALGTLLCAGVVGVVAAALDLEVLRTWGDRIAGGALLVTGLVGVRRWLLHRSPGEGASASKAAKVTAWSVLSIGFIHGVTGAAAVLMLLPAAVSESMAWQALYLGGFAFGSTLAMSALTAALSASSKAMPKPGALLRHVPAVASFGSVMLGGWWVLA
jgi:nickel/cobalt transporter (NicO) family protein